MSHRKELKKKFKGSPPSEENHKIFSGVVFPRPHHYCQGQQNRLRASAMSVEAWRQHGGGGSVSGSAKHGDGAQRDGSSAVAAARRLRRCHHRHRHDIATATAAHLGRHLGRLAGC